MSIVCSGSDNNSGLYLPRDNNKLTPCLTFNGYGSSSWQVDPKILYIVEDLFKKYVPLESPVIDIGCGFGSNSCGISQSDYKNVYAIDLDSNNYSLTEQLNKSIHFIEGAFPNNIVLGKLPTNNWGIVLFINVFHCMNETEIDQ